MSAFGEQAALLRREWRTDPRWSGITRDYTAQDVIRLRDGVTGEHGLARHSVARHSVARHGASRLWGLLHSQDAVRAHGAALPGTVQDSQPTKLASSGSHAIYLPGWQTAEGNLAEHAGPGQSPVIVGAGGVPGAFELMTALIEAGAAGVRFDDQLPRDRGHGHPGEQVLISTGQHIETLSAARLAADVLGVASLVIARTAAGSASLLTSDADERDHEFLTGERTAEGLFRVEPGLYACGTRALAFAPYADLLWLETPVPDLAAARAFACVIHSQYPDKLLAYSCASSSGWQVQPDDGAGARFRRELAAMGYRFQVTAPAGFRAVDEPVPSLVGRPA